jgi:glyoxylase-like metal-dependent hydrolase (beta-lactamase superfamily II)
MLTLDVQEEWPEETLAFYRSAGMDPDFYAKRKAERPFNFADVVAPMPLGFKRLDEGDTLQIGAREFAVRLGQGHAPDHITLWSNEVVLAGDQMIANISSNLGVYATEPEADPVGAWFESCERLRPFARPEHLVLPGHKLPYTGLATRLTQLIDNHHTALDRLSIYLEEPRTAAECFHPLFKRKIGEGEYGLALVESIGHLNHLHQLGSVTRTRREDDAYLWRKV